MSINISIYESGFGLIITKFLNHEISPDLFISEFTELWMTFRDDQMKIKESWDRPYDQELISERIQGKLTSEEFSEKYLELWGITEFKDFDKMINYIHSLFSSYAPEPESEWQVNEDNLRAQVTNIFQEYKSSTC